MTRELPFPFIVGRGRSGTTLLRAMLDSHSEMAVPDETHFVVSLAKRRGTFERPDGFAWRDFLAELVRRESLDHLELDAAAVESHFRARPPESYADAVRRLFGSFAEGRGKSRYADKTPNYVFGITTLAEVFDESRFVHVIRDGRDVALSYLDVPWGPSTVEEAAFWWRHAVTAGRRAGAALGPERYLEVRYEDLVADPQQVLTDVCRLSQIEFEPTMLAYFERADSIAGAMRHPETREGLYRPPTHGLRDWRQAMSVDDVTAFEAIAGPLLQALGYERAAPQPGAAARGKALATIAKINGQRGLAAVRKRLPRRLRGG